MGVILAILLSAASICPHVGPNADPAVAALIEEGTRVSTTFRLLAEAVDARNGRRISRLLVDLHHELSQLCGALGHLFAQHIEGQS